MQEDHFRFNDAVAVTFLFLNYKMKDVTALQLLKVLFKQLTRNRMTAKTLKELKECKEKGKDPKADQLLTLLKAEINAHYSTVVIVVDALDEIEGDIRAQLLRYLRTLPNIRLIATSRDIREIKDEIIYDECLEIFANEDSMKHYIEGRISRSPKLKRHLDDNHQSLREELISTVINKADGMWVQYFHSLNIRT